MIRFRNPGTQYSTQLQVIRQLYEALGDQSYFTLDDMAIVIAQGRLITAYGYAGNDALRLSNTEQDSMNSAKMNAKMYAEVFRMLGWVTPYRETSSYPLVFTYIGIHVALHSGDCGNLYEQCVLGINNPTQLTDNLHYTEKTRFFKCALRTFIELGGTMYKHELCLGPMSVDDEDEQAFRAMIEKIQSIRGSQKRLKSAFEELAANLGMKPTPVDNCTRLPIALMKSCNWITRVKDHTLYGKSMTCLRITEHGRETYDSIKNMYDLRLDEWNRLDRDSQEAAIRLGTYSMLRRAGYDISGVRQEIDKDYRRLSSILRGRELLFSPCQTLRRTVVEPALGIELGSGSESIRSLSVFDSGVRERKSQYKSRAMELTLPVKTEMSLLREKEDIQFLEFVNQLRSEGLSSVDIVSRLFAHYENATQTTFYPLIATLFKVMGFRCSFSRPGDNGARWDAIIDDKTRSIPIEIKSPTEERHLSIKAIRQALENKIILLSRETHKTKPEVTSLAVGYYMPNERAEVINLIEAIRATYGYRIGVIDLYSLLSIAVSVLVDGKGFDKEELYSLEGLRNAHIFKK